MFDQFVFDSLNIARRRSDFSLENLCSLIRTPSPTGEELEAQDKVAKFLRRAGADVQYLDVDLKALFDRFPSVAQYPTHWEHDLILPYDQLPTMEALKASGLEGKLNYNTRPNVIGRWSGTGGGRSLILNGHVDTVTIEPTKDWSRDPYGAHQAGDRLYGRGTSDMKGGLMAGIMAMHFLKEAGVELKGDVIFQSVVNEEHSGNGTLDLVRRGISADAAIVLEPTNNQIMTSHPGGLYWQVKVPGEQRSPGARWRNGNKEGVSAIENLVPVIDALLGLEKSHNEDNKDYRLEDDRVPFSLIIGKVSGGHYDAATAGEATIRGGAYFSPALGEVAEIMQQFRCIADEVAESTPYLKDNPINVEFLHHDDSTRQSPQIPIAMQFGEILANEGKDSAAKAGPFACDMRHLVNQGGIPSIIFGPGDIAQAHKPDEYISIKDFQECIGFLIGFIPAWCNGTPLEKD